MNLLTTILKGFSQVFFSESALLGSLILAGVFITSPLAAIYALTGNITSMIVGFFLPVNKHVVDIGVYGFNGVLIGTAVAFYVKNLPLALVLVIIGSVAAALIFYFLSKMNITPFALPFVTVMLLMLLIIKYFKLN